MRNIYKTSKVGAVLLVIVFTVLAIVLFFAGFSQNNLFGFSYTSAAIATGILLCLVFSGVILTQIDRFRKIESYSRNSRSMLKKTVDDISSLSVKVDSRAAEIAEIEREVDFAKKLQAKFSMRLEKVSADHENSSVGALATHSQVQEESRRLSRLINEIDAIRDEVAVHHVHGSRLRTIEAEVHEISEILKRNESFSGAIETLESRFSSQIMEVNKNNLLRVLKLTKIEKNGQEILNNQELKLVSKDLSEIDPVTVAWLYSENEALSLLPLRELRRISLHTRKLGYWRLSNTVLRQIVSVTKSPSDITALDYREDELSVFEGKFFPQVNEIESVYAPEPGFILHVVGKVLPKTQSGYTLRTHYSAKAQIKSGYKVAVIALIGESDDSDHILHNVVDEVSYYRFPGIPRNKSRLSLWLQSNVDQLADFVSRERPEALHAHSDFLNALVASVVGNRFGIPVVYESRGFWEESWLSRTEQAFNISDWKASGAHLGMPEAYSLRQQMEIQMRSKADHVITLAKVMKQHIVDLGNHPESVSIIPNAVDASHFPIVERDINLVSRLGIPDDALVIGYISSIVEYEGIDILIRAFDDRARADLIEAHLLIVGDGAHLDYLKMLVSDLGTPRVHFTGRVPHGSILSFYSVIDIFVVPRRPAAVCRLVTPLKPFEAFSTGRAVVVSNVDALLEISQEGECARTFQAGDHLSLATELVSLAKDPGARKELGKRAANWVRTARSWDANAEAYQGVYSRLGIQKSFQI